MRAPRGPLHEVPAALPRWAKAGAVGLASGGAVLAAGLAAWASGEPLLAPPLGATAFQCFHAPLAAGSAPRNVLTGHALGLAAGYFALHATGAAALAPALAAGLGFRHALATALAIALTVALTECLRRPHTPAGATTLVVSLGVLAEPRELAALALGALLVVAVACAAWRAAGVSYPLWAPRR